MLLDLRVDGCLSNNQTPSRELLKNCSGRLNRAHSGFIFVLPMKTLCMLPSYVYCSVN